MMGTSKRKRNPGLFIPKVTYRLPYNSPFKDFLGQNSFFKTENKSTEKWSSYPIYLKETIFFFSENFKKARDLEVGYKFFSADDLKEQANVQYYKRDFKAAINLIVKAISLFKWLDCEPDTLPSFSKQE